MTQSAVAVSGHEPPNVDSSTDAVLDQLLRAAEEKGRLAQTQLEETRRLRKAEEARLEAEQRRAGLLQEVLEQVKGLVACTNRTLGVATERHTHLQHRLDILTAFVQLAIPVLASTTGSQDEVERLTQLVRELGKRSGPDVVVGGTTVEAGGDVNARDVIGGSRGG